MFKDTNFIRYFLADSFAKIADNYFFLFITWLALQITGSPAYAGAILMANAIPRLVFMVFGGSLADRVPPQILLRTGNIVQAVGLFVILTLLMSSALSIPVLFIIAILFGLVDAFSAPASMSAIPRIVPKQKLLKANSLIQGNEMAVFIVGSLLAGLTLQFNNLGAATLVNALLYVIAFILFFTVRIKFINEVVKEKQTELARIVSGLKYTWKKPILRANIFLLAATNIAITGPASIGLLLLITDKLALTPIFYSIVSAAFGVGAILGAISASRIKKVHSPGKLILASYLISGLIFVAIAFSSSITFIIALMLILGLVGGVAGAINSTWTQLVTKPNMLGRVSALTMIAALAFDPISQGLTGFLAEWSVEGTFIVAGIFMIAATLAIVPFNKILLSNKELPLHEER